MISISLLVSALVFVLSNITVDSEPGDFHVKFSLPESQLNSLTQRVRRDEENFRQKESTILSLQRQVDNSIWQLKNVSAMENKNHEIKDVIGISDPTEVAFYAELTHELEDISVHSTIKFDDLVRMSGTTYGVNTGILKSPTSGFYLFSVFIESYTVNTKVIVGLRKEGTRFISEQVEAGENGTGERIFDTKYNAFYQIDLQIKISQLESQLNSLTQRDQQDEKQKEKS